MSISNVTQRNNLVYNSLKWVFTTLPSEIPEITVPTGISFNEVAIDSYLEKTFDIQNPVNKICDFFYGNQKLY